MKTLSIEQMEVVQGGGKCGKEQLVAWGSAVATIASAPSIFGLGLGLVLTGVAVFDWWKCEGLV